MAMYRQLVAAISTLVFLTAGWHCQCADAQQLDAPVNLPVVDAETRGDAKTLWHDVAWPWKTDPEFLERRRAAVEELRKHGRLSISRTRSEREEPLVYAFEGNATDAVLERVLPFVPELKRATLDPSVISVEGLRQLAELQYLEHLYLHVDRQSEEATHIANVDMEAITKIPNLRVLSFHRCQITDDEFARLGVLRELEGLGVQATGLTPNCFCTIAKWPKIEGVSCTKEDFSQPIDRETHAAIASLNGRLTSLYFGEWDAMALHPSLIPAIAEIKSLTDLWIGDVRHLTAAQLEPLTRLPNLINFNYEIANREEHKEVLRRIQVIVNANQRYERERRKRLM